MKIRGFRWQNSLEGLQIVYGSGSGNPGAIFRGQSHESASGALFRVGGKTTASLSSSKQRMRNLRSVHQSQPTPSLLNFSKIEVSYLYTKDGLKKRIQGFHQLCRRKSDMNSEIGKVHSGAAKAAALRPTQKRAQ